MEEGTATTAVPQGLGPSAVELLGRLIQTNTVNPPGNEDRAQEFLREELTSAGFECELLEAEAGRPNLVARLRGAGEGPTLAFLGHVDTVRADPEDWTFDPWAGDVVDGWVRGRGALDMKGQVAAEVAACIALGQSDWRPAGELLLVLTADEEVGGGLGAHWLCEQHPDKVRADFIVNEGGGESVELGGRRLYTLSVGEKGIFRMKLRTHGRAGHASVPRIGDNALLKLARHISALSEQPQAEPSAVGEALLEALTGEPVSGEQGIRAGLERLRAEQPLIADFLVEPMLGVTLAPTIAQAGKKANVIPAEAEVLIDCRVPPGDGEEEALAALHALIGEGDDYTVEFSEAVVGNSSPLDSPLADAIHEWVGEVDPGAGIAPIVMPGFSDSNPFRTAFPEAVVYGFCPHREIDLLEAVPLIHGADERVPASDVEFSASFFYELPRRMLG